MLDLLLVLQQTFHFKNRLYVKSLTRLKPHKDATLYYITFTKGKQLNVRWAIAFLPGTSESLGVRPAFLSICTYNARKSGKCTVYIQAEAVPVLRSNYICATKPHKTPYFSIIPLKSSLVL
jgi:hypothetical protein